MVIVTNRIKVKPDSAERMAPMFTAPSAMHELEGFHKVEVLVVSGEEFKTLDNEIIKLSNQKQELIRMDV